MIAPPTWCSPSRSTAPTSSGGSCCRHAGGAWPGFGPGPGARWRSGHDPPCLVEPRSSTCRFCLREGVPGRFAGPMPGRLPANCRADAGASSPMPGRLAGPMPGRRRGQLADAGPSCRADAGPTPGPARRCRAVLPGRCRGQLADAGPSCRADAGPPWPGRCQASPRCRAVLPGRCRPAGAEVISSPRGRSTCPRPREVLAPGGAESGRRRGGRCARRPRRGGRRRSGRRRAGCRFGPRARRVLAVSVRRSGGCQGGGVWEGRRRASWSPPAPGRRSPPATVPGDPVVAGAAAGFGEDGEGPPVRTDPGCRGQWRYGEPRPRRAPLADCGLFESGVELRRMAACQAPTCDALAVEVARQLHPVEAHVTHQLQSVSHFVGTQDRPLPGAEQLPKSIA